MDEVYFTSVVATCWERSLVKGLVPLFHFPSFKELSQTLIYFTLHLSQNQQFLTLNQRIDFRINRFNRFPTVYNESIHRNPLLFQWNPSFSLRILKSFFLIHNPHSLNRNPNLKSLLTLIANLVLPNLISLAKL